MIRDFDFCVNTEFIFGREAHRKAGDKLKQLGINRLLIHHDGGLYLYDTGLLKDIKEDMERCGIQVWELSGVKPNPRLDLVYQGIRLVRQEGIQFILAIGGGSVIDSSKAIGAGAQYEGDVWDFFYKGLRVARSLPVGVVLTCPATGSESGDVCVINNTGTGQKLLTSSQALRPVMAFMNPLLTTSLPPFVTACSVTDMFSHVCERYFTPDNEFGVIDRMAEGILKTLAEAGPALIKEPDSYRYRAEVMWIGTIAHNDTVGIGRIQDWATHEIGNELSALYDTPHGVTLSVIMGSWMKYVYRNHVDRFARYGYEVFGISREYGPEEAAYKGIEATEAFFRSMRMPVSLKEAGIGDCDMEKMLDHMNFRNGNQTIGGMEPLTRQDVRNILDMARG